VFEADITKQYAVPGNVLSVLKAACFDCHGNNTNYPWYSNTQPGGWWMASHVRKGKEELNFSEFGNYSTRRQKSKLKAIANSVRDGEMPLSSYTLLHPKAKLSEKDRSILIEWAEKAQDNLEKENLQ
jgi:hypothetical protein